MSRGSEEQVVYGVKASLALFRRRPQDIVRVFHSRARRGEVADVLRWAAGARRVYREVDVPALDKLAKSPHHEGVVIVARPLRYAPLTAETAAGAHTWVVLDAVDNPHNLGAILRTCGFFGVQAALVGGAAPGGKVNTAALRVAQGGAEAVALHAAPELPAALALLKARGVALIGLETDAPAALGSRPHAAPWALVLGHEQAGLSPAVRRQCTAVYAIRGSGHLGSLNVSVAAALGIAALLRGNAP